MCHWFLEISRIAIRKRQDKQNDLTVMVLWQTFEIIWIIEFKFSLP